MSWILRHWRASSIAVIAAIVAWAFWPGVHSFLYLDDFFLTAISRLLDNPLAPFVHNHFPGGLFFRPLAFSFWWLSVAVLGSSPLPQYLLNLVLHIGICLLLWQFLCNWTHTRVVPLLAALVFGIHPIAIGTSLWLSDRFDLLAVLFGLLALDAARRYRISRGGAALIAAFVCAAGAALSKEIGLAVFAPIFIIWVWPDESNRGWWSPRRRAALGMVVLALALIVWRSVILGSTLETRFVGGLPVTQILIDGVTRWIPHLFGFLLEFSRLSHAAIAVEAVALLPIAALALFGIARLRRRGWRDEDVLLVLAALSMLLATGVLQAPTLRLMGLSARAPLGALMATESRVFYYSLLSLITVLVGLVRIALEGMPRRANQIAFAAVALCIVPWIGDAHHLARQYRHESYIQMQLLQAAKVAVDKLALPASGCTVYVLGVEGEQEFIFSMQLDAAMKALATDLGRVEACRFTSERTPWFFVLRRDSLTPASAAPMQPAQLDGIQAPWLRFGGVEISYLNLFDSVDAKTLKNAYFLAFDDGQFHDVTQDVLAGKRQVKFRCGRRPEQCVAPAPLAAPAD